MNFSVGLSYFTAVATVGIGAWALYRNPRSFVHRVLAVGMAFFALDAGLSGLVCQSTSFDSYMFRYRLQLITASFLPALWLLFSLIFARANYSEQVSKWKWILFISFFLPVSMIIFFNDAFFAGQPVPTDASTLFIRIGWSGYLWFLAWVVCSILILMNMERTFRHATGHIRWQTKFIFLGIGSIFGIHLFTDSQVILFKGVNSSLAMINLGSLLIANLLILRSLFRGRPLDASIHLSHQFLYNSFTVIIVGIYFLSVGVLSWFSLRFEWIKDIHLLIFLIFAAVIGLATILLSDRLRMKRKIFISKHFKRPQYDYQKIWEDFTGRTASVTHTKDLCNITVRMVWETLETLSVSIWLVDEKKERLSFGGSTVFTSVQAEGLKFFGQGGVDLIHAMTNQTMPVDLESREDDWVEDLKHSYGLETKESRIRYCVPLNAAGHLIGIMTMSEKVFYQPLTFEEFGLVKTIADQAAAALLNLRLSEQIRHARELEAFQSMSAFFMHDLKNLASKLSLVTQNLPLYADNPEFRNDALRTIEQSVLKLNTMSSRLSVLSQKVEISRHMTDINELVKETISKTKGYIDSAIVQDLHDLPQIMVDRDQLQKALENLLINANEATGSGGQFTIVTDCRDSWVEIDISDNGCGMSREFINKHLFRPFQTTKKKGMGIGLFHCKTIVEAHNGKIEVESEEGKGTTFRVLLPIK